MSETNTDEIELLFQHLSNCIKKLINLDELFIEIRSNHFGYHIIVNKSHDRLPQTHLVISLYDNILVCHSFIPTMPSKNFDLYDPQSINNFNKYIKQTIGSLFPED